MYGMYQVEDTVFAAYRKDVTKSYSFIALYLLC